MLRYEALFTKPHYLFVQCTAVHCSTLKAQLRVKEKYIIQIQGGPNHKGSFLLHGNKLGFMHKIQNSLEPCFYVFILLTLVLPSNPTFHQNWVVCNIYLAICRVMVPFRCNCQKILITSHFGFPLSFFRLTHL